MTSLIAFTGGRCLAAGDPIDVALEVRRHLSESDQPVLVFDRESSRTVELDLRGSDAEIRARLTPVSEETPAVARGRPKLGVVAREVTLLPRQWEWLSSQRGGASASLRRLISEAQRDGAEAGARRLAQESLHRFITVIAGNYPGFEEAVRALFAGDAGAFLNRIALWPEDVRAHAQFLAKTAFAADSGFAQLVPPDRLGRVQAALLAVTTAAEPQSIARLTNGASGAIVLKAEVGGQPYVLRLDCPGDGFRDPARQYACHAIASQAEVAPRLLYADVGDRVSVSVFKAVDDQIRRAQKLTALATTLRKLHATPLFPPLMPFLDAMALLLGHFGASGTIPVEFSDRMTALIETVRPVCQPSPEDIVSSHNDLNPNNILIADSRAWFVDWECAFAADRYHDLGTIVNFFGQTESDCAAILAAYFGREPEPAERARLELMRQVSRLYYGVMLLNAARRECPELSLSREAFARAASSPQSGGIGTADAKIGHAAAMLSQAFEAAESDSFQWALGHAERD